MREKKREEMSVNPVDEFTRQVKIEKKKSHMRLHVREREREQVLQAPTVQR